MEITTMQHRTMTKESGDIQVIFRHARQPGQVTQSIQLVNTAPTPARSIHRYHAPLITDGPATCLLYR